MSKSTMLAILSVSACALGFSATPAFAVNEYKAFSGTGEFTGTQMGNHVFKFGSEVAECKEAKFKGKQPTPATSVKEVPSYALCANSATVTVEFCAYELLEPQGGPHYTAEMHIVKEGAGTCAMEFVLPLCTITVGEQAPKVTFLEEETIKVETMNVFFKGTTIKYKHVGFCPGIGTGADGTYNGTENILELGII
jgi:hypothetical protein